MGSTPPPDAECWLHPDVVVQTSHIAGRGLFAAVDLGAGTLVSRLGGRLVDTADDTDVTEVADAACLDVADGIRLVLPPGADNRLANHSCDPNLGWAGAYTLVTVRDVPAGTELVHDYATSMADPGFALWCHCETYRCRQVVEGTDWQIPQLQTRYAGYWTPLLRRRIEAAG